MDVLDVQNWPRQQLRLTFFDFSVRGEGDTATVAAVIRAWESLGALSRDDARHWSEALAWRDEGGFLPGWAMPAQPGKEPQEAGPEASEAFEAWRSGREQQAAA